jgi:hypothetical protein
MSYLSAFGQGLIGIAIGAVLLYIALVLSDRS